MCVFTVVCASVCLYDKKRQNKQALMHMFSLTGGTFFSDNFKRVNYFYYSYIFFLTEKKKISRTRRVQWTFRRVLSFARTLLPRARTSLIKFEFDTRTQFARRQSTRAHPTPSYKPRQSISNLSCSGRYSIA